jgi:replicative DNA helicase
MAKSGGEVRSAIDKSLPHDRDAERLILGAIVLDNTTINQAAERLTHGDFFLDSHRRIFEKMIRLFERGAVIDPYTLQDELRRAGELEMVGGMAAISNLFEGVPRFSNIDSYTGIVKGKSILRRLITTSNQIMSTCFDAEDEPDAILDQAERLILSIAEDRIREGFVPIGTVAEQQFKHIGEIAAKGHQLVTGVATGFFNLDSMTSGLQRGDLVVIAARPSMGKTAFGLNIAQNVALQPRDDGSRPIVGIFSLEMSKEQLAQRLLCSQARIDAHLLRKGILSKEDWRKLAGAVSELGDARIFLDDTPSISVMEMRAKSRRLKNEQHRLDLLIVDYLQLMGSRGRVESRQQEVSQISRELKGLAKELNVPLIALSQLNRAPEARTDKRPQLSDLRESGSIEQDADVVMFIFREDVYKPETERQNIAEIIIGKQRNGPTGTVELVFLKNLTRFEEKYNES